MPNTPLTNPEKNDVIDLLVIEMESAFDRLLNKYSTSDQAKYAKFVTEMETHLKKSLQSPRPD
jgi:hypothetical protein